MKSRIASASWAAWAFALALLLKAAMPLLAASSAQIQGKALVEVCTVYGVATVALDGADAPPIHDGTPGHAADNCVLNALTALGGAMPAALAAPVIRAEPASTVVADAIARLDPCAAWMARLGHAPPLFA
jgi:Protein of unknown function (DUF2946)